MQVLEGVSEFAAVAETSSFTVAGKRLGISTAQVSRQVSALEHRLGTKLFYRTTRKVSMTEAGQLYYQQCRRALDELEEAERAVTNLQLTPRGLLRLTAPVTYGEGTIAPILNDYLSRYPDVEAQLHLTNQMVDLVADGYDLAIRLGKLEDSTLMARRLTSRTFYVCASPDYLARHGEPHALSELDQHRCLLGTQDTWRFQEQGRARSVRVKGRLRCNSGWALVDAALKGMGLIQLPDYYVKDYIEAGELVSLLEPYQEREDGIWGVYPHNRHLSPKVSFFLDHLTAALKG
ncbi:LysR substrate-binding domain-containing protein [Pseudovibrio exalbescens]|uniref:LysR family transcriptional regulator n=1 Tax=Pseudovibrio exalbescens TaxID=197461 RepID=A0A1U7JF79_9HYPH|nr:LysR substrate-binding domain-containing protein [Pseudovibrio exalbescens]OKL43301.1 LysR family transcriptional regulator [Pseudovibrio exalbescens]